MSTCYFIYRKEIGYLCKWRRGNADKLEVPDIATKECDPIYLRPITFNAQSLDEELDKFILCRKKVEPQSPTMTLYALEDLRNHPSVESAYIYFRRHVSVYQRQEWVQYREHMIIPFITNRLVDEQFTENPTIKETV
jgi:hypothetical protein